jgi:hypothetical protein
MPAILLKNLDALNTAGVSAPFLAMTGVLFVASLCGELLERTLFFTTCAAPRMPGGLR